MRPAVLHPVSVLALVLVGLFQPSQARAGGTVSVPDARELIARADAIFVGSVIETVSDSTRYRVEDVWWGELADTVWVVGEAFSATDFGTGSAMRAVLITAGPQWRGVGQKSVYRLLSPEGAYWPVVGADNNGNDYIEGCLGTLESHPIPLAFLARHVRYLRYESNRSVASAQISRATYAQFVAYRLSLRDSRTDDIYELGSVHADLLIFSHVAPGSPEGAVVDILKSPYPLLRRDVIRHLGLASLDSVTGAIVSVSLLDPSSAVQAAAALVLSRDPAWAKSLRAAFPLSSTLRDTLRPMLTSLTYSGPQSGRGAIITALAILGDTASIPAMKRAILTGDSQVFQMALEGLTVLGDSSVLAHVISILSEPPDASETESEEEKISTDEERRIRHLALDYLLAYGGVAAKSTLARLYGDYGEFSTLRRAAGRALLYRDRTHILELIAQDLKSPERDVRQLALRLLMETPVPEAVTMLKRLFRNEVYDLYRWYAVQALVLAQGEDVCAWLSHVLVDITGIQWLTERIGETINASCLEVSQP